MTSLVGVGRVVKHISVRVKHHRRIATEQAGQSTEDGWLWTGSRRRRSGD
jgi:hypothetical protein